ncbi:MAG: metal ABC transporter substrate-binding protein [Clostridiales bacterium]|nr:metal ABC transporter substrate-binding protein [Clostridiales bacterium]
MKKHLSIFAVVMASAMCLSGCGSSKKNNDKKLSIVTTIFPEYDWVMNILGDKKDSADVTMLLDNGVDLHSYQPTADDIVKIKSCDMFIYVGGESDEWVEDVLETAENKDMVVVNLLEELGGMVKEEELIEGMQEEEHDHDHDHEHDEHDEDEHEDEDHEEHDDHDEEDHDHEEEEHEHEHHHEEGEAEYDEHVWLSLKNASILVDKISQKLQSLDSANAETYEKNGKAYIEKLNALDKQYEAVVAEGSIKTLLFGDRFPFRYMVDDYGLTYYAAFIGCSAETEASFETIAFLSEKTDELNLHTILTIEGSDQKIAKTIVENTSSKDQKILVLDSMQSVTSKDVKDGASYFSVMEKNLEVLKEALK